VLLPGDELFIPDPKLKTLSGSTGKRHVFVRKRAPLMLRLQFVDQRGKAYGDAEYTLDVFGVDGVPVLKKTGRTPSNGLVEAEIPVDATGGKATLVPKGQTASDMVRWELRLGHLDPGHEAAGAQARLRNLGVPMDMVGGDSSESLKAVLLEFQELHGLAETGELDAETLGKLEQLHDTVT
jgi:hypothetical protein